MARPLYHCLAQSLAGVVMGRAWPWLESWRRRWQPGAGVTPLLAARLEGIRAALVSVCHGHLPMTNQDILISRGWRPKEVHPTSGTGSLLAAASRRWELDSCIIPAHLLPPCIQPALPEWAGQQHSVSSSVMLPSRGIWHPAYILGLSSGPILLLNLKISYSWGWENYSEELGESSSWTRRMAGMPTGSSDLHCNQETKWALNHALQLSKIHIGLLDLGFFS